MITRCERTCSSASLLSNNLPKRRPRNTENAVVAMVTRVKCWKDFGRRSNLTISPLSLLYIRTVDIKSKIKFILCSSTNIFLAVVDCLGRRLYGLSVLGLVPVTMVSEGKISVNLSTDRESHMQVFQYALAS